MGDAEALVNAWDRWAVARDQGTARHFATVIYRRRLRDGLRKTYWVRCFRCDLNVGPLPLGLAKIARIDYDGLTCLPGGTENLDV